MNLRLRPWMRRPRYVISALLVVFVGAAVITDLPVSSTSSSRLGDARTYVKEVNADAASCEAGMRETFTIEGLVRSGTASAAEQRSIPSLLRDDVNACSYTNQSLVDMGNLDRPGGHGGGSLDSLTNALMLWEFPAANEAITAVSKYLGPPRRPRDALAVAQAFEKLSAAAAKVKAAETAAVRLYGGSLPQVRLPAPPSSVSQAAQNA